MGVYIKGLKLPSAERQGELLILTDDGRCVDIFSREYEAIELQPHSRLIDADALNKTLTEMAEIEWNKGVSCSWAEAFEGVTEVVDFEPTIIEAEDGT